MNMKFKKPLIISGIVLGLSLITITLISMTYDTVEQQPYRVVHTEKEFEIRFYPRATLATITSSLSSYSEMANPGFRKLASYIFGGNKQQQSIAMTAPVHMDIKGTGSSMSFVMPGKYDIDNLPEPNDPGIRIEQSPEEYVAAIRFGGYASDKSIRKYSDKLKNILEEKGITYHGNFRYLGYNSPFRIFARRNEIIVGVSWTEKK
jgi:hypothetical protein